METGQQLLGLPIITVGSGSCAAKSAWIYDIIQHSDWYIVWPDRSERDCLLNIQPMFRLELLRSETKCRSKQLRADTLSIHHGVLV